MKQTELQRRTPLRSKAGLRPGGKLKPIGKRGKRLAAGDAEARQQARERAQGICEQCGEAGADHHHWVRRGIESVRHHRWNQIYLCRECHDFWDDNAEAQREWIRANLPPEHAEWIFHQRKGWRDDRIQS